MGTKNKARDEAKVHCDAQSDVKACYTLQRPIQIIGEANLHHF